MSVFDYIQKQKEKFQGKREAILTARHEDKQEALLEIRQQRKKAEARAKTDRELTKEKETMGQLKREAFKSSTGGKIAGKIFEGMKKKIREGKKTGPYAQGGSSNPFTSTGGSNPFTAQEKTKKKKQPGITIIVNK